MNFMDYQFLTTTALFKGLNEKEIEGIPCNERDSEIYSLSFKNGTPVRNWSALKVCNRFVITFLIISSHYTLTIIEDVQHIVKGVNLEVIHKGIQLINCLIIHLSKDICIFHKKTPVLLIISTNLWQMLTQESIDMQYLFREMS